MAKKPKGTHVGFARLKRKLAAKGLRNPGGAAYKIGVKKYGKAGMASLAAKGRAKTRRKKSG